MAAQQIKADLAAVAEAILMPPSPDLECNVCGAACELLPGYDPSSACNDCAQEQVIFLAREALRLRQTVEQREYDLRCMVEISVAHEREALELKRQVDQEKATSDAMARRMRDLRAQLDAAVGGANQFGLTPTRSRS